MKNIRITNEYIESLKPCKARHDNYLQYYKNTDFSIIEFLQLENITYEDKIWVWKKFATINEAAIFGLKCASSVLHIFEEIYPEDKRPRLALEASEKAIKLPTKENKYAPNAAYAVAAAANAARAVDAAVAAAANAARAVAYAANAAYAAATAAAYAAADNIDARKTQQEVNLMFLVEIYEGR